MNQNLDDQIEFAQQVEASARQTYKLALANLDRLEKQKVFLTLQSKAGPRQSLAKADEEDDL